MNCLQNKLILFLSLLVVAVFVQPAGAQTDVDAGRMNRDIKIMENILQEMFKTRWSASGRKVHVRSGAFPFGTGRDVRGTYLPGYGVIFTIPGARPAFVISTDAEGEISSFVFQYGNGENDKDSDVTEENVTERIIEFLRDYGPTIGQLQDHEKVMVIFDTRETDSHPFYFSQSGDRNKQDHLPTISVVAEKQNLNDYRTGRLTDNQFEERLEISRVDPDVKEKLDLKVMANILETAFKETEEESFRMRGSVQYLNLDNFGAMFSFEARYGRTGWDIFSAMDILSADIASLDVVKDKEGRSQVTVRSKNNGGDRRAELDEKRKQQEEEAVNAYQTFLQNLKEYLVDYGSTLSSIGSDQYILVSVSLSGPTDEIPARLDLQVQKSVLEQADRGDISREQAMEMMMIRDY